MPDQIRFFPGGFTERTEPLSRYFPPVPDSITPSWLNENVRPGGWLLDSFGFSPRIACAAARLGYKVLVVSTNPIIRFLHELAADPPAKSELQATLAALSMSPRGEQRLEPYILSIYQTECSGCSAIVSADAFIWERNGSYPVQRIYQCPACGVKGEFPTTQSDIERATQFTSSGLHRARALERVLPSDDPERIHVEAAINTYLPRAIFVLLTLINKLEGFPAQHQQAFRAMLLMAFDQSNMLWHYPPIRFRPRQLSTPLHFLEKNIWRSLETTADQITRYQESTGSPVPCTHWPELPPDTGGICIFTGRLKDFSDANPDFAVDGMLAAIPRPNQALWTYSALWSGWLWGAEVAAPFKIGLRRRRYDWGWHTQALQAAFSNSKPLFKSDAPLMGLVGELETGFLSSVLIAGDLASLELSGIALRPESNQAQISWQNAQSPPKPLGDDLEVVLRQAIIQYLRQRAEPAEFLQLQAAGLQGMYGSTITRTSDDIEPGQVYSKIQDALEVVLSEKHDFIHFGGKEHAVDIGLWALASEQASIPDQPKVLPLSDRIEMECVRYLLARPSIVKSELDTEMCRLFPGLFTPDESFVLACLQSYGEPISPDEDQWLLRPQDSPAIRRREIEEMSGLLLQLGTKFGFSVTQPGHSQVGWIEAGVVFSVIASAIIGRTLENAALSANACIIVLPGSRAALAFRKIESNPILQQYQEEGLRFLKYRHLRRLYENHNLTPEIFTREQRPPTSVTLICLVPN